MTSIKSIVLVILWVTMSVGGLSGCASNGKDQLPRGPIKKIAILPIQNPLWITLDRSGSPYVLLGFIGQSLARAEIAAKSDGFRNKIREHKLAIGEALIAALEQGLIEQHYDVVVLRDQNMGYDEPKDFDYRKLTTDADAIIHVIIDKSGVSSPLLTPSYRPQLNVDVRIISAKNQRKIDDWGVEYGADASMSDSGNIPADPKYAWLTYETLLQKIPEVVEGLQMGAKVLGSQIAKTLREKKL